jgi:Polysaccharide biosynthesis protein
LSMTATVETQVLCPTQIEAIENQPSAEVVLSPGAAELARFKDTMERGLDVPGDKIADMLAGQKILIPGGTGRIGNKLIAEIQRITRKRHCQPPEIVCLSRGVTEHAEIPGVRYISADVRDHEAIDKVFQDERPNIVFHLAAQRDPGLAETEKQRTYATNTFGTKHIIQAAEHLAEQGAAPQVISATTGKALRPYARETYTNSKIGAEMQLALAAARAKQRLEATGDDTHVVRYAAARFTHVVDNSIVGDRLRGEARDGHQLRLHSRNIGFYAQSALESAQLILVAGLDMQPGVLTTHANSQLQLGDPISLELLAQGIIEATGSPSTIREVGYDDGYEKQPWPGMYDPHTAGECSPLMSAFEAWGAIHSKNSSGVDSFDTDIPADDPVLHQRFSELATLCLAENEPDANALDQASQNLALEMLRTRIQSADSKPLARIVQIVQAHGNLSADHARMLSMMESERQARQSKLAAVALGTT